MIRTDISQNEFLEAVVRYEKEVHNSDYVSPTSVDRIYRFKAVRRDKIVVILLDYIFDNKQLELVKEAAKLILGDENLSDNIDFYTTGIITDKRADELEQSIRHEGLSISFYDLIKIENASQFKDLFDEQQDDMKIDVDPAFFDYLAMSNDSSDIKNGFFYSLLLMEIYRHQPINEIDFLKICNIKYGKNESEVRVALRNLKKKDKITPLQKGGVFYLTDKEQRCIENAIKESKIEETSFKESLRMIIRKYGLSDELSFYEKLRLDYLAKYTYFSKSGDTSDVQDKDLTKSTLKWDDLLNGLAQNEKESLLNELRELCSKNDYMDQYGLIHSFLELFRSDRYEGYITQKEHYVYLDTPVIVSYICLKSSYQNDYNVELDNNEFISANDLFTYRDESMEKLNIIIPHDYLYETLGELKKALQFSWFNQFDNLPIPVETANLFYNYYQEVKKAKLLSGNDNEIFTFEEFANNIGFNELNPESHNFFIKNIGYLRFFLEKLGCQTLDKVDVNRTVFDNVKSDYVWYLHSKNKDKSDLAINADVRQSLHITDSVKEYGENREYDLVSWDNTLYQLRNITKDFMEIAGRSYNVFKPGELAEKLAFRSFRINKEAVSNEVFAYANSSFNVNDKIRSLYDNVLNPYFSSFGKSNSTLVLEVLKMQKSSMEGGEFVSAREDKTALENIFQSIIIELPKQNCSTQNLKDYLNDDRNNDDVIPLFMQAFVEYQKDKTLNIARKICEMVKEYVSKNEQEIIL